MIILKLFCVLHAGMCGRYWSNVQAQGNSYMVLEDSYLCKNVPEPKIKYYVHPKDFNPGYQLVDINMTIPIHTGHNVMGRGRLDFNSASTANNGSWIHLITIEGELCKTVERYLGEFWYDIQQSLGMMRRSCPFPRGTFHAINHHFDFLKLKVQTFPIGTTRVTMEMLTKQETLSCVTYILSNTRRN